MVTFYKALFFFFIFILQFNRIYPANNTSLFIGPNIGGRNVLNYGFIAGIDLNSLAVYPLRIETGASYFESNFTLSLKMLTKYYISFLSLDEFSLNGGMGTYASFASTTNSNKSISLKINNIYPFFELSSGFKLYLFKEMKTNFISGIYFEPNLCGRMYFVTDNLLVFGYLFQINTGYTF